MVHKLKQNSLNKFIVNKKFVVNENFKKSMLKNKTFERIHAEGNVWTSPCWTKRMKKFMLNNTFEQVHGEQFWQVYGEQKVWTSLIKLITVNNSLIKFFSEQTFEQVHAEQNA